MGGVTAFWEFTRGYTTRGMSKVLRPPNNCSWIYSGISSNLCVQLSTCRYIALPCVSSTHHRQLRLYPTIWRDTSPLHFSLRAFCRPEPPSASSPLVSGMAESSLV